MSDSPTINLNSWIPVIAASVPEIGALVRAILALRKKYPDLSPEQIASLVTDITGTADAEFDKALAKIEADQQG